MGAEQILISGAYHPDKVADGASAEGTSGKSDMAKTGHRTRTRTTKAIDAIDIEDET
jgi:hypothetical protein